MNEIKNVLTEYAEAYTSDESVVLRELREYCNSHYEDKAMLSGFFQGRVLAMLSKMIRPKVVLEIGTYLGYSALCFAEGLADGGKVITNLDDRDIALGLFLQKNGKIMAVGLAGNFTEEDLQLVLARYLSRG